MPAMSQLDGASDSKPSRRPSGTPLRSDTDRSRNRFANLFSSVKHTATDLSTIDPHNEVIDADSPIRMVSPRATASEPPNTLRKKQRTLSFKRRKTDKSENKPDATLQPEKMPEEDRRLHVPVTEATSTERPNVTAQNPDSAPVVSNGAHVPVLDAPYPCQPHDESVGFGSPTRETA
jgi:hypothetical protein